MNDQTICCGDKLALGALQQSGGTAAGFQLLRRALAGLLIMLWAATACAEKDRDVDVTVQVDGDTVHVDVAFAVKASPQEVWAVITDFEHMAQFISNLTSSQVLSRNGNVVIATQKGKASVGPLSFEFDSVRELRLTPFEEIRTRMVSGNMKSFESVTRLHADGSATRFDYHSVAVPGTWIPPVIGRNFIEAETREQFGEMRREILRRNHAVVKP